MDWAIFWIFAIVAGLYLFSKSNDSKDGSTAENIGKNLADFTAAYKKESSKFLAAYREEKEKIQDVTSDFTEPVNEIKEDLKSTVKGVM